MNQLPLFQPPSLTVSELTRYLRDLLDSDELLHDIWVQGEISNFSRPSSGHLYFTLKDGSAALRCVVWRSTAMRLHMQMQNGLAIEAHGGISIYERDGQYQLYVDAVRPAGEGRLYQEFMRLKNQLEAEGLFDEERKRQPPQRPRCIGIVTSATGAALQDMLNTLRHRYPLVEVLLSPCAVQGDSAPAEIVNALGLLYRSGKPDVILLARGGGSLEDLWAFNDERVVRAVVISPVPVITGVGHETDFTLADFACDLRAPTPTGAAMLATPDRADLLDELAGRMEQLNNAAADRLNSYQQDLNYAHQRLERASPLSHIRNERQALDGLQARSERATLHMLQLRHARWQGLENRLQALNPSAILQRGFALVQHLDGSLVRSIKQAQLGQEVEVHLWDGSLSAQVKKINEKEQPPSHANDKESEQ